MQVSRFEEAVELESMPSVLKARGAKQWTRTEDLEQNAAKLEAKVITVLYAINCFFVFDLLFN